ncbi:hypothetical protein NUSPORA_02208 [Nucleospora cyclopteri]
MKRNTSKIIKSFQFVYVVLQIYLNINQNKIHFNICMFILFIKSFLIIFIFFCKFKDGRNNKK